MAGGPAGAAPRTGGAVAAPPGFHRRLTMLVFHSPSSAAHDPQTFFRRGAVVPHPERAERYATLLAAVSEAGHHTREARDHGLDPVLSVHTEDYVTFLREAWQRRGELSRELEEVVTSHFARPQMHARPGGLLGLLGYHTADTSTPIRAGTWAAVYGAAQTAVTAADAAAQNGSAYALCRPPGHHAYADSAGGFCFLNNTAIAAERLLSSVGGRVAILDVDVHHGNGTQHLFYRRGDVLTVSIHADPSDFFPFYAGYEAERGEGAGLGCNRNLPLVHGSGDAVFLRAVDQALGIIEAEGVRALVVALGLDASEDDPIGALRVTTDGFARAARAIASADLPTALVQEGGYPCPALPRNLVAFLESFDAQRAGGA